jgi:hypothetical protein
MLPYLVLAVCGCFAGVTTVLFGFGGGFIVVPLLYWLVPLMSDVGSEAAHSAMQIAVATSTCVMIFGASLATIRHHRIGSVDLKQVRPLIVYIAGGAMFGAATAIELHGEWIRWAFVSYLGLTILDCLFRPGFISLSAPTIQMPSRSETACYGLTIGLIAAFLGVGGSVMTVPLLRRRGIPMTKATAMANPLSLPVAIAGTATYIIFGNISAPLDSWHLGYVDMRALVLLVMGSWIGIRLATPLIGLMPDRLHAKVYLALLVIVLIAMVIR